MPINYGDNNISTSGIITATSGNFSALQVNATTVSISGHNHTTADILLSGESLSVLDNFILGRALGGSLTDAVLSDGGIQSYVINDFNNAVSGLFPTISNSGDNRLLTSTGSSFGINAENNLTFDGSLLNVIGSGNFTNSLQLNGTGVSVSGHTHTSSDITNFNSAVSGLVSGVYVPVTRTITPGSGLVGTSGLDLSADRTLHVGQGDGLTVSADAVAVNNTVIRTTGDQVLTGDKQFRTPLYAVSGIVINGYVAWPTRYGNQLDIAYQLDNSFYLAQFNTSSNVNLNSINLNAVTTFNKVSSDGALPFVISPTGYSGSGAVTQGYWRGETIEVNKGGTGRTSYSNGQLLIGSGTSIAANTLSAGTGINITNGSGSITIAITGLINNPTNNRVLTSRDNTSTGIDAESNLTFDGSLLNVTGSGSFASGINTTNLDITARYTEKVVSTSIISSGLTLNLNSGNLFTSSLNSNISSISITGVPVTSGVAVGFSLIFTADGTARTVTWPSGIKWAGNTAPTLTSASGKRDFLTFISTNNGTDYLGFVGGQDY